MSTTTILEILGDLMRNWFVERKDVIMHVGPAIEEVNLCAAPVGLVKMVWQQLSLRMYSWSSGIAAAIGRNAHPTA